jgi:hypothetical protein
MSTAKERLMRHLAGCHDECRHALENDGLWASMRPEDRSEGHALFGRIQTAAAQLLGFIERGDPFDRELVKFVIPHRGDIRAAWESVLEEGHPSRIPKD